MMFFFASKIKSTNFFQKCSHYLRIFILAFSILPTSPLWAQVENIESYTANWVDIVKVPNGKYRVLIKYSNVRMGEYRDAYADFNSKKEAISVFQKLAKGAEFYWGQSKQIIFKEESKKLKRY